jgi:hypothetical protein
MVASALDFSFGVVSQKKRPSELLDMIEKEYEVG